MTKFRVFKPSKLTDLRGDRNRREISELTNGIVTEQDIYAYEKGLHSPSLKKLPYLLAALKCEQDDLFELVTTDLSAELA